MNVGRRSVARLVFLALGAIPVTAQQRAASLQQFSSELETLSQRVSRSTVQIISTGYRLSDSESGSDAAIVTRQRATGSGVIA